MADENKGGLAGLGLKAPGLNGQTAQSEGSAGTETTTSTREGTAAPAVDVTKVDTRPELRDIRSQGNAASLRNDPPKAVTGVSGSLVNDVNLDVATDEDLSDAALLQKALATQTAANSGAVQPDAEGTMYSSHPIANYRLGRFQFEKGLLRLDSKDAADFEQLLTKLPVTERARVQKLDVEAAVEIVRQRIEDGAGRTTKQFDSSTGERPDPLGPTVGTVELGFANRAQQDMNAPVIPTEPIDPKGDTGLDQGAHTQPKSDA